MTLQDLRYALAVAEYGHFSRAAEACGVSQPTLSGQVRKLEDSLGVAIFERDGRHIRVTAAGAEVLESARAAVAAADAIVRIAAARRDPLVGALRLGVIPTLAPYLLPLVLPRAAETFPKMPLVIAEEQTHRLIERLLEGQLDAALIATPPPAADLVELPLFEEPLLVALPVAHRLAAAAAVLASDLADETLLLLADGHCLKEQALALCEQGREPAGSDLRASSLETLLNLVEAGYGVTVIPALAERTPSRPAGGLVTRPFAGPPASRSIRLVTRRSSPRRIAAAGLADLIRAAVSPDVARWAARAPSTCSG